MTIAHMPKPAHFCHKSVWMSNEHMTGYSGEVLMVYKLMHSPYLERLAKIQTAEIFRTIMETT